MCMNRVCMPCGTYKPCCLSIADTCNHDKTELFDIYFNDLTENVEKHNNIIERLYVVETKITNLEHEIFK